MHGHAAYRQFKKVFFLKQCARQVDDLRSKDLLLRLRDSQSTNSDYDLLSSRFSGVLPNEQLSKHIRLFPTKEAVDAYSRSRLQELAASIAAIECAHNNQHAKKGNFK